MAGEMMGLLGENDGLPSGKGSQFVIWEITMTVYWENGHPPING